MWYCKICEKYFEDLPPGTIELVQTKRGRTSRMVQFPDKSIHAIKPDYFHVKHHVGRYKKIDCPFCRYEDQQKARKLLTPVQEVQDANQTEQAKLEPPSPKEETTTLDPNPPGHHHPDRRRNVTSDVHQPEDSNPGGIMAAAFNKLFRQQEDDPDWQDGDSLEKF